MAQLENVQVNVAITGAARVAQQVETARTAVRRMATAARTANQEMAKLRDLLAEVGIEVVEDREVTDNV